MVIYEYLHDFFVYLFDYGNIDPNLDGIILEFGSNNYTMTAFDWLIDTCCIITIILFILIFIKIAIWLFKMGANLFKW